MKVFTLKISICNLLKEEKAKYTQAYYIYKSEAMLNENVDLHKRSGYVRNVRNCLSSKITSEPKAKVPQPKK